MDSSLHGFVVPVRPQARQQHYVLCTDNTPVLRQHAGTETASTVGMRGFAATAGFIAMGALVARDRRNGWSRQAQLPMRMNTPCQAREPQQYPAAQSDSEDFRDDNMPSPLDSCEGPLRRTLLSAALVTTPLVLPAQAAPDRLALSSAALGRAKGKVAVITGATSGVGLEAARTLVAAGGDVYVCGRTLEKASAAASAITPVGSVGRAVPVELNLASLASVRKFAAMWKQDVKKPIDILACNAGLALGQDSKEPQKTEDGFELTIGTNHLGHFLLVNLLMQDLSPSARVVMTASSVHDPATGDPGSQATLGDLSGLAAGFGSNSFMVDGGAYDAGKAYKDSKLCNVEFTLELARRLKQQKSNITINCLSPGLIPSKTFFRYQNPTFSGVFAFAANNLLKITETPEFGGDTLVFMALDPSLDGQSGKFYSAVPPGRHEFVERTPSPEARNEEEAAELWRKSSILVGI